MSAEPPLLVVLCTVPDEATAEKIGRGLVEERLAACVNVISSVKSFYRWQGKIEADDELQLVIKTRPGRFPAAARWIRANHPYEVPEIVALPASAVSDDYLRWAVEQTKEI